MNRGPVPDKGFEVAIPHAERRGQVLFFRRASQDFCDFMIKGAWFIAIVRLRLAGRLRGSIAEIGAEFSGTITGLGSFPASVEIFRELWLYSRHGALRFFRLGAAGLMEIDCFGIPFVNGKPAVAVPAPAGVPDILSAGPVPPGQPGAGAGNSPAAGPVPAVRQLPGGLDPKSPIARWLLKRNAGKKPDGKTAVPAGTGATGSPGHGGEGNVVPVAGESQEPGSGVPVPKGTTASAVSPEPAVSTRRRCTDRSTKNEGEKGGQEG